MQLVGSAKVSRHHACVEWNVERSSFCVTDLSSVGLLLDGRKIAVERNLAIVPRSYYAQTALADGDRIEIVAFVGGG